MDVWQWIMHSWDDERCIQILRNCLKALPEHAAGGSGGAGRRETLAQRGDSEIRSPDAGDGRWRQGAHQSAVESALGRCRLCSHSVYAASVQSRTVSTVDHRVLQKLIHVAQKFGSNVSIRVDSLFYTDVRIVNNFKPRI